MHLLASNVSLSAPATGAIPTVCINSHSSRCSIDLGSSPAKLSCMQKLRVSNRSFLSGDFQTLWIGKQRHSQCQGFRSVKLRKARCSARIDEDPDWERKSSNGSASSSSNGTGSKSAVREPRPFVASDGTPKPGIFVVSSPGARPNPQDSGFASQLPNPKPRIPSSGADSNKSGDVSSRVQSSNGVSGSKIAEGPTSEQITNAPSCPMPNFATTATRVTLLQPVPLLPSSAQTPGVNKRPLLIYVPGMDGTGQGIRPQIEGLYIDGYDIRCVYIPSGDRSTWDELVGSLLPLIEQAALLSDSDSPSLLPRTGFLQYANEKKADGVEEPPPPTRHVTLLAESFGTCLALRVAARAPSLISRLVLINPATNFDKNNWLVSLAAATGLLAAFPGPLYSFAQDVMLPLLVKRNRVSADANKDLLSPIDYVPAACAAWRLHMLNEGTPSSEELAQLKQPVMLFAGAKDRVLPSMSEAARLQTELPNAWRVILPESGHTALLEDNIDIASLIRKNGFAPPRPIDEPKVPGGKPRAADPSSAEPSPPDLTELAASDPTNPGVVALNPGVSGAANSANPRVRDAVHSANETPAVLPDADGATNADASGDVSGLRYESPVPKRRRAAVSDETYDEMGRFLEPWRIVTSPLVSGAQNLPDPSAVPRRPILFVGNHTIFGLYDSPLLVHELYMRGFRCRGLAHEGHWRSGTGQLFERYGNVKATPFAAYKLLKEGEDVLLFPGGAREVVKRKGEEYQLLWKEKADFVRMASKLGAIIVPFGALGGDDAFKVLWDARDILGSPVGPLVEQLYNAAGLGPDLVYPVTRLPLPGLPIPSPIPIPAIERIYFHFAPAIDTSQYACDLSDPEACQDLYGLVRRSVEESIAHLKEVRARDPERLFPARMLAKASRLLPEFSPRE